MKFLFIGGFELPNKNAAAQRILAIAEMLISYGHRIDIIGVSKGNYEHCGFAEYKDGIRIANTPYPNSRYSWLIYLTTLRRVKSVANLSDYDAVLCYNYPAVPLLWLSISRYIKKYMLILDITEWYRSDRGNYFFRFIKKIDVNLRMHLAGLLADRLIVASEYLKSFYARSNAFLLPTLVPKKESLASLECNSTETGKLIFIYAGLPFYSNGKNSITMKDRIDHLVEAFLDIDKREWELNIYGVAEDEYIRLLNKEKNKIFGERIHFHGRVPREKIICAYLNSHYSIFFRDDNRSNNAGFPTKLSESFEFATPVITNDVGDSKMYIGDLYGFVFPTVDQKYSIYLNEIIDLGQSHSEKLRNQIISKNPLDPELWKEDLNNYILNGRNS